MRPLFPAICVFCLLLATKLGVCQTVILQAPGAPTTAVPVTVAGDKNSDGKPEADNEKKRKPGEVVIETVAEGLNNPFSVSLESDRVFVAESGAGRIVEIKDGKPVEVAGDFTATKFRGYKAGPLCVEAIADNVLLVGHNNKDGVGSITQLKLKPDEKDPAKMQVERETVSVENKSGTAKLSQISNIRMKHSMVYAVTHGDAEHGWIALTEIQKGKLTSLSPSIPTTKRTGFPGPTCITTSPDGEYLVISQMGKEGEIKDSRLVFYTLQGKLLRNFEVELHDIVALAYSPSRKHLFAIDYNFEDPGNGALYKLIGTEPDKCGVKKLLDLSYATSMEFDSNGNLYVTTLGGPPTSDGKPAGKLIRIMGLDDIPEEATSEVGSE